MYRVTSKKPVWTAVLLLGMVSTAWAQGKVRTVLVVGDSLSAAYGIETSEGWVARADRDAAHYRFENASIAGDTTAGGRARIVPALARTQPDICVIELGANDGLRGLPAQEMERNLAYMIGACHGAGAKVLLLGMTMPPNYGHDYVEAFSNVYPRLAKHYRAALVPYFLAPLGIRRELFQPDNLHPTAAAQPLLAKQVLKALDGMGR